MNSTILNELFTLCCQFLTQVSRMLVFDIFNDWLPTDIDVLESYYYYLYYSPSFIIDLITITWCVYYI